MAWSRSLAVLVVAMFAGAVGANGCSSSGGGAADAGDAATDTKPPPKDAGNDAAMCGAVACEVCDTTGYFPSQMVAPTVHANVCSPAEIQAFVTACGASGTQTTCDAWQTAESASDAGAADAGDAGPTGGPDCLNCVFSDQAATKWGVYVCGSSSCSLNTPGCLDVALGQLSQEKAASGAGSCGDAYNASYGCQDFTCGSCTGTDFDTCTTHAIANECSSYDAPVESTTGPCAALNGDAGVPDGGVDPTLCFATTDNDLAAMATLLCGAP